MRNLAAVFALFLVLAAPARADNQPPPPAPQSPHAAVQIEINHDSANAGNQAQQNKKFSAAISKILDKHTNLSASDRKDIADALRNMGPITINASGGPGIGGRESSGELAVAMLAIIFIFGSPIMIVAAVLYWAYRRRRLTHDTINQYLASGKEIPPQVMEAMLSERKPKNNLQKGLALCGTGLGIFLCFLLSGSTAAASFGLIPLFIGLAQLLIWKLEKNGNGDKSRDAGAP